MGREMTEHTGKMSNYMAQAISAEQAMDAVRTTLNNGVVSVKNGRYFFDNSVQDGIDSFTTETVGPFDTPLELAEAIFSLKGVTWKCFHCHEVFTDNQSARDHFGYDDLELPACIQVLTEEQKAIVEDRREWRNRAYAAESKNENLEYALHLWTFDVSRYTKQRIKTPSDIGNVFEELEGRALAAEDRLNKLREVAELVKLGHKTRVQGLEMMTKLITIPYED